MYPGQPTGSNLTQWQRFALEVDRLKREAASDIDYKVLFMDRHGDGYHNDAEAYYGTPAWNCYWSLIDGNGTLVWSDAQLSALGVEQALVANKFWSQEIKEQKIPTPDSFYVSPLTRCLQTANVTFVGVPLPPEKPFKPTVKELLREGISEHTCDRRSSKSYIEHNFPTYDIEPGFAETDQLWTGVTAETSSAQAARSRTVLDDIFSDPKTGTYVSITSHSGELASILAVLGHRPFILNTGAVIPVLVKAERKEVSTTTAQSWTASAHCTMPPVSSISGGVDGGCVCAESAPPVTTTLPGAEPTEKPLPPSGEL